MWDSQRDEQVRGLREAIKTKIDKAELSALLQHGQLLGLGSWGQAPGNAWCALQYNQRLMSVNDVISCPGCSRHFCKDHKLDNCTYCNKKL